MPEARVGEEGGGDDDAVAEVVDAVAEDHAPAAAAGLLRGRSRDGDGARRLRGDGCGDRARPSRAGRRTAGRRAGSRTAPAAAPCAENASGRMSSSAVASSTPADRLTRWWTTFDSTASVSAAATITESRPPSPVARTIQASVTRAARGQVAQATPRARRLMRRRARAARRGSAASRRRPRPRRSSAGSRRGRHAGACG